MSPARLERLRARFNRTLPRTCTVPGAATVANTGDGTWSEGAAEGTADVKCSFVSRSAYERMVGGVLTADGEWVLTFEAEVALSASMTIAVDADEEFGEPAVSFQLVGPISGPPRNFGQMWTATKG